MPTSSASTAAERELARLLELAAADRDAALAELRARDPVVAAEVEQWLHWLGERRLAGLDDALPERLGDFRLLRRLGGGGMGEVYVAEQVSLARQVALKLLRPEQTFFAGARERFFREAKAIAALDHANVVPVHAVGEANGVPYLAMELVDGHSVAGVLRALASRDPAVATPEAAHGAAFGAVAGGSVPALFQGKWSDFCLRVAADCARALVHAHAAGIVHRDVKPSNLMIARDGRVLLLDFGLARSDSASELTRTGSQPGSLPYMAPEQLRGESVDERIDVYGLGVTLYQMLALRLPFEATTTEELRCSILQASPPSLRVLNPRVSWEARVVVEKAMEPDAGRRYQSAAAFLDDLTAVLERRPIRARPPSALRRAWRAVERRPARSLGAALAFVVLVAGPTILWLQARTANAAIRGHVRTSLDQVNRMVETALSEELRMVPGATTMRNVTIDEAIEFYEHYLAAPPADIELRRPIAVAWTRLAACYGAVQRHSPCRAAAERALLAIDGLDAPRQWTLGLRVEAKRAWIDSLARTGEIGSHIELIEAARAEARELADGQPSRANALKYCRILEVAAESLASRGRHDDAGARHAELRAFLETKLSTATGSDRDAFRRFLCRTLASDGMQALRHGHLAAAQAAIDAQVPLVESLAQDEPVRSNYLQAQATLHQQRGQLEMQRGRRREAVASFELARQDRLELRRLLPRDRSYHVDLLRTDQKLIGLYEQLGELDRARALFGEVEDLAGGAPVESFSPRDWQALVTTYAAMARIMGERDAAESRRLQERGLELSRLAPLAGRAK